jgi:phosphoribosylamine--glycine ligase
MHVLLLGGGGREHALAWAIRANPKCDRLTVAPGNPGIAELADCVALDICDGAAVTAFARAEGVDLVVIGPEAPLAAGVADALAAAGIPHVGPTAAAARLETSKSFTKEICDACGAPTAAWARFEALDPALAHLRAQGAPIVVKADGLAAGKGVTVAQTLAEAEAAVRAILADQGASVVIEEFMSGEEASFFVLCDGTDVLEIGTAQDHKRAFDGDTGPNTGGMGAYSPAPVVTPAIAAEVMARIIRPTLAEMARRGTPFRGILYAGLMIADGRARLVEYNTRLGDPEAQVLAMRLGAQLLDLLQACAEGRLAGMSVNWAEDHALCVVMATRGYPGPHGQGSPIGGLDRIPPSSRLMVFHAGTRRAGDRLEAAGGRVLGITARERTLRAARDAAYAATALIDWPEGFCRRDIGARALPPS